MLQKIKDRLRISHTKLDSEIEDTIKAARAEMVRAGVSERKANDEADNLILQAVKTYCLWNYANDSKVAEGYKKSWEYQLENIRKTPDYAERGDLVV